MEENYLSSFLQTQAYYFWAVKDCRNKTWEIGIRIQIFGTTEIKIYSTYNFVGYFSVKKMIIKDEECDF